MAAKPLSVCNCENCLFCDLFDEIDLDLQPVTPPPVRAETPTIVSATTHYSVWTGNLLCQWATGSDRVVLHRKYSVW